jgi:hypothetical protein
MTEIEPTVTVASAIHGERTWRRLGTRERTRRDGTQLELAIWESRCTICGAPFEIATASSAKSVEQTKRFLTTTCPAHRMTPSEVGRLRSAKRDQRRSVFEAIKATRLAAPCRTQVSQVRQRWLWRSPEGEVFELLFLQPPFHGSPLLVMRDTDERPN